MILAQHFSISRSYRRFSQSRCTYISYNLFAFLFSYHPNKQHALVFLLKSVQQKLHLRMLTWVQCGYHAYVRDSAWPNLCPIQLKSVKQTLCALSSLLMQSAVATSIWVPSVFSHIQMGTEWIQLSGGRVDSFVMSTFESKALCWSTAFHVVLDYS